MQEHSFLRWLDTFVSERKGKSNLPEESDNADDGNGSGIPEPYPVEEEQTDTENDHANNEHRQSSMDSERKPS